MKAKLFLSANVILAVTLISLVTGSLASPYESWMYRHFMVFWSVLAVYSAVGFVAAMLLLIWKR